MECVCERDGAVDGADEDVGYMGRMELGVAIGVAVRVISVAVGETISIG